MDEGGKTWRCRKKKAVSKELKVGLWFGIFFSCLKLILAYFFRTSLLGGAWSPSGFGNISLLSADCTLVLVRKWCYCCHFYSVTLFLLFRFRDDRPHSPLTLHWAFTIVKLFVINCIGSTLSISPFMAQFSRQYFSPAVNALAIALFFHKCMING